MTDENLIKMASEMPNFAKENLDRGFSVSYRSEDYPNKHLREYPDGKIESIEVDLATGEIKVLEIIRASHER